MATENVVEQNSPGHASMGGDLTCESVPEVNESGLTVFEADLNTLSSLLSQRIVEGGYFFTFEGGDGSGKTTVARLLTAELKARDIPVLLTREPGGTELGTELRRLVMHGPNDVDPRTEALLYAADRAYHVAKEVRPAMANGMVVVGDRYIDSSVAYQGAARQLGTKEIRELSEWATGGLYPNLTIYFDVDCDIALARMGRTFDRVESSGVNFHRRVRQEYLRMVREYPDRFVLLDASGSIEDNFKNTVKVLIHHLGSQCHNFMWGCEEL